MSDVFQEGDLELTFDGSWKVIVKWDSVPAYRDGIQRLQSSRAVDFCGVRDQELILLELKDFRGARIENKPRFDGEIYEEVALKVRDTLAGVLGAARVRQTEAEPYRVLASAAAAHERPLRVLLWLDEDRRPNAAELNVRTNKLKQMLRWLTARVRVESLGEAESVRVGVAVRYLQRLRR